MDLENPEGRHPIDPVEYARTLAREQAVLDDKLRREYSEEWEKGMEGLESSPALVNVGVLLTNGVRSGLTLPDACAIALSSVGEESPRYNGIRTTLDVLRFFHDEAQE